MKKQKSLKILIGSGVALWETATTELSTGKGTVEEKHTLFIERYYLRGPIPPGLTIDHLCRVHPCAQPTHLEVVTVRVNVLRGETTTAFNAQKTHCVHGHEFTLENTRVLQRGERVCITCDKERYARWKAKQK